MLPPLQVSVPGYFFGFTPNALFTISSTTTCEQKSAKFAHSASQMQGNCNTPAQVFHVSFCPWLQSAPVCDTCQDRYNAREIAAVARSQTRTTACQHGIRLMCLVEFASSTEIKHYQSENLVMIFNFD